MKWQVPLWEVQYYIEKVDIIFLSILPLHEVVTTRYIDIPKKYLKRLGIEDIAISIKLLILKKDFLTMCNVNRAIYWYLEELRLIIKFQFITFIVKLFSLEINILKLFLGATWDIKGDWISFAHF